MTKRMGCTDMNFSTKEYFVRETYKSIRRNGFMSVASISTVAVSLMVLGIFLLLFLNSNNLAQHLEKQVQVSVYMQDDASQEELDATKLKLEKLDGVVQVTAITKKEALERFKERLGDQQKILETLGGDNPFPNSFDVQVKNPDVIKGITDEISKMPKVETARFGQDVVEHLFQLIRVLRFSGILIALFLGAGTLFIIVNTIRLTVFARRKEVEIMKYVGATDWFIRWPFMLEGMALGFLGAVVATVLLNISYASMMASIHKTLAFLPLLATQPLMTYMTIFLLLAGIGIGALGSYISLHKFLRV